MIARPSLGRSRLSTVGAVPNSPFAVQETYEHEGKVVVAVLAAGACRIVLNQDDGKLGWDRIKGQGFYLQINVAAAADVDAAAARVTAAGGTLIDEPADRPWGVSACHRVALPRRATPRV
ncbi:MAG: VOC family protein [Vicinamibacterales bacterium]